MPLAVLEAMEAGLPVVATRVVGSEEVVVDGVTGALVPFGRPAELGAALAALLADPLLRRRQGTAARRRYSACFTRDRMARETAAVYEELAQTVARPALTGSAT
jgi:glycosyltransferase involved in cell wall biosynthesis